MLKPVLLISALLLSVSVHAITIKDVEIPDVVSHSDQSTKLYLNGAGIRSKFIFDIYIGSLYLEKKQKTPDEIYHLHGEKRVSMHFLYDEVSKDKLVSAWNDGFKNNHSDVEFKKLESRLKEFNKLFRTVKKGDVINLNFIPTTGTIVVINKETKGTIEGDDFFTALLKVWLGEKPADKDLKDAMLGRE